MATEQELQQREQQLNQIEQEARKVASQKVPRRTFGSRIGPKEQQAIISNKQKAEDLINQVQQQRQQIQQIRQQQVGGGGNEQVRRYNYGRKLALSGKSAYGLSGIERQGYIDAKQGLNNIGQLKKASSSYTIAQQGSLPATVRITEQQAQELPPIRVIDYTNRSPTIIQGQGAYDLTLPQIRQLELSQEQTQKQIAEPQLYPQIKSIQESRNPIIRSSRAIVNAPVIIRGQNSTVGNVASEAIDFTGEIFDKASRGLNLNNNNEPGIIQTTINKDVRTVSEIAFYTATAPITIPVLILSGLNRIFNAKSNEEFFTGVLEVSPAVLLGAGKTASAFKNYKFTDAEAFNIIDRQRTVKLTPKQRLIENVELSDLSRISNEEEYARKIKAQQDVRKEIFLTELQKRVDARLIEEPKLKVSSLDNKPLVSLQEPNIDYKRLRALSSKLDEAIKYYQDLRKPLRVIEVKNPKVRANQAEVLKSLDFNLGEVRGANPGEARLRVTELGEINKKGYKYNKKDFSRSFREAQFIERKDITKERLKEFVDFAKKELDKRNARKIKVTSETGKELVYTGSFGLLNVEKELLSAVTKSQKILVEQPRPEIDFSKEIGSGRLVLKLEKQSQESVFVNLNQYKTVQIEKQENKTLEISSQSYKESSVIAFRQGLDFGNQSTPGKALGTGTASTQAFVPTQSLKYQNDLEDLNASANDYASRLRDAFRYKYSSEKSLRFKYKLDKLNSGSLKLESFGKRLKAKAPSSEGYKTYYFSGGKKIYLPGISSRGGAIFKGESKVLRSLSARFGLEKTNQNVTDNNVNISNKYAKYFRNYKIVKGKNIKTPDVFIQKLGKRLSTKTERGLIQKARRGR